MSLLVSRRGTIARPAADVPDPGGFAPDDIASLSLWYDTIEAFTGAGLSQNDQIGTWEAVDTFGPDLTNGVADQQPRYDDTNSPWASEPALWFNGLTSAPFRDYLRPGATDYVIPATDPWTVFFVFDTDNPASPAAQTLLSQFISTAGNGRILFRIDASELRMFLGDQGSEGTVQVSAGALSAATRYVGVFRRDGNSFTSWLNGTPGGTRTDSTTRSILQTRPSYGTRTTSSANSNTVEDDPYRGHYGAFLKFDTALSTSDREDVQDYLAARF